MKVHITNTSDPPLSNRSGKSGLPPSTTTLNTISSKVDMDGPTSFMLPDDVKLFLGALGISVDEAIETDPSVGLVKHIVDCLGYLRDIVKIQRNKNSIGFQIVNILTGELGKFLINTLTNSSLGEIENEKSRAYSSAGEKIMDVFPEMVSRKHKVTGKLLLHHTCFKAGTYLLHSSMRRILLSFPSAAASVDNDGALPLHWLTQNPNATSESIDILLNVNPDAVRTKDKNGLLPFHWAVSADTPNIKMMEKILSLYPDAISVPSEEGFLPIHYAVNCDRPSEVVIKFLVSQKPESLKKPCCIGRLPIHYLVDRSEPDMHVLKFLLQKYPEGLEVAATDGNLPLHIFVDQDSPSLSVFSLLVSCYEGAVTKPNADGYYPLHLSVDCMSSVEFVVEKLLELSAEPARMCTLDGMLPLHLYVNSNAQPGLKIATSIFNAYPPAAHFLAIDAVPTDPSANPDKWTGEWNEVKWTPFSRAFERRLPALVDLMRRKDEPSASSIVKPGAASSSMSSRSPMPGGMPTLKADAYNALHFDGVYELITDSGGKEDNSGVPSNSALSVGEGSGTAAVAAVSPGRSPVAPPMPASVAAATAVRGRLIGGDRKGSKRPVAVERPNVEQHLKRMTQLLNGPLAANAPREKVYEIKVTQKPQSLGQSMKRQGSVGKVAAAGDESVVGYGDGKGGGGGKDEGEETVDPQTGSILLKPSSSHTAQDLAEDVFA